MRRILSSVLIIGILIGTSTVICYANSLGIVAASFLKIGVGARASAMGEAFSALTSDGTSLYWNPTGLTEIKRKEVSATYNSWFEEIKQGYPEFHLLFIKRKGRIGDKLCRYGKNRRKG